MAGLLVGTLAFACFFVYDLNQLHQNLRCLRWLFAAGCTLLAGATAWLLFSGRVLFSPPPFWSALAWAVCAVFLFLLVYTLFFALPFGKTYIKGDSRRVCDTGVYALCRHPGFLWLAGAYLFAFLAGWGLARWRASRPAWIAAGWNGQKVDDLLTWIMLGVVAGGRLGYVLFYDLPVYLDQPSEIFKIWNGGMSFHGGLIGVLLMGWWWSRRNKKKFMDVVDFVAPLVPPGLFFGRIGNFINGELWGGVTDGPLGMVFPTGGPLPRHPSQLYEAGLEGLVLFVVLWVYSSRIRPTGRVSGLFAVLYGVFRFAVEFVRQPDPQLGYLAFGWLTMGQLLCVPLLIAGLWLLFRPVK